MRILIADDEVGIRRLLLKLLDEWGHEGIAVGTGAEAWEEMEGDDPPHVAILDWNMPHTTGVDVVRLVRGREQPIRPYLLILTGRDRQSEIVEALRAGANDYVVKPFDYEELHARLQVGIEMVDLQIRLAARVNELQRALEQVKSLQGLLPICAYCKRVRNDRNYWEEVENCLGAHAEVHFSHGVCPDCYEDVAKPEMERMRRRRGGRPG